MVAIMRPLGEVVATPFEIKHTEIELKKLVCILEKLPGETRIVMEHTVIYWQPIVKALHNADLWVSVVNALLIHKYGNNSIRKGKTAKLDAVKIANYCLDHWLNLDRFTFFTGIMFFLYLCLFTPDSSWAGFTGLLNPNSL